MNRTNAELVQPLAYRLWDQKYKAFFYTDALPQDSTLVDRWTGFFDKQGNPLFENDIIRVHYDWKYGWVRARITRRSDKPGYFAQAATSDGTILKIGFFCFEDSYRVGNMRETPGKLVAATEQFPAEKDCDPWWHTAAVYRSLRSCLN